MDVPGSNYLLSIATLSIAFVSFSTIVVVLRQVLGEPLSPYLISLVRLFIETGLTATALSLLPPLLGLLGIAFAVVWRLSSVIMAAIFVRLDVLYILRRRKVQPGPLPLRIYVNNGISAVVIVGLALNALGALFEPNVGPYALAVTWVLIQGGLIFVETLGAFLERPPGTRT
jgi:hypothetical protein